MSKFAAVVSLEGRKVFIRFKGLFPDVLRGDMDKGPVYLWRGPRIVFLSHFMPEIHQEAEGRFRVYFPGEDRSKDKREVSITLGSLWQAEKVYHDLYNELYLYLAKDGGSPSVKFKDPPGRQPKKKRGSRA